MFKYNADLLLYCSLCNKLTHWHTINNYPICSDCINKLTQVPNVTSYQISYQTEGEPIEKDEPVDVSFTEEDRKVLKGMKISL